LSTACIFNPSQHPAWYGQVNVFLLEKWIAMADKLEK